jgi:carboxypeptidase C (cathepsin A)
VLILYFRKKKPNDSDITSESFWSGNSNGYAYFYIPNFSEKETINYQLVALNGKILLTGQWYTNGSNRYTLNIEQLSSGMYLLKINNQIIKFIKP